MIVVDSISKKFKLYRSPSDRLKELVFRKQYHHDFAALNNVSFTVADGETLGIVGQNGAGKSTLLKILTGILLPDSGTVSIDGKITGLLELGTGFNVEMTGVENIYMNGTLLGMTREEIDRKKNTIIEFTELGEFVYEQLKTYSSGMVMRLAFAVAIHADPKCFVVDEALSVGDAHFQQKCMTKIKEFRMSGGSIIFVSHDLNAVKLLCDKAILLNQGKVIEEGNPNAIVNSYNFLISKLNDKEDRIFLAGTEKKSYGTFEASITKVTVTGDNSRSAVISSGERTTISIELESYSDIADVNVGMLIRDRFGQDIFGTNLYWYEKTMDLERGRKYVCNFTMAMNIGVGKYSLSVALAIGETHLERCLHWRDDFASFEVAGNIGGNYIGIGKLYPEISIHSH